jgi:sec-independent protein translocase protein TatA
MNKGRIYKSRFLPVDSGVILVVCLVIFGPGKLPEIGQALGKGIRDFQRAFKQPPQLESPPSPKSPEDSKKPEQDR